MTCKTTQSHGNYIYKSFEAIERTDFPCVVSLKATIVCSAEAVNWLDCVQHTQRNQIHQFGLRHFDFQFFFSVLVFICVRCEAVVLTSILWTDFISTFSLSLILGHNFEVENGLRTTIGYYRCIAIDRSDTSIDCCERVACIQCTRPGIHRVAQQWHAFALWTNGQIFDGMSSVGSGRQSVLWWFRPCLHIGQTVSEPGGERWHQCIVFECGRHIHGHTMVHALQRQNRCCVFEQTQTRCHCKFRQIDTPNRTFSNFDSIFSLFLFCH